MIKFHEKSSSQKWVFALMLLLRVSEEFNARVQFPDFLSVLQDCEARRSVGSVY